jgi:hypothetical protein
MADPEGVQLFGPFSILARLATTKRATEPDINVFVPSPASQLRAILAVGIAVPFSALRSLPAYLQAGLNKLRRES